MAVLLTTGLALNMLLLQYYYSPGPKQLISDEDYYFNFALAASRGEQPADNPLRPPLYAEFLTVLFAAFGPSVLPAQLLQICLWFFTGLLVWRIAQLVTGSASVALTALALYEVSPDLSAFSHYLWPETLHLFLWILALWLLMQFPGSVRAAGASGIALGLALLTKSALLPFIPVLGLFVLLGPGSEFPARIRVARAMLLVLATFLTVLPAMLGNSRGRGQLMINESSVFNVWVGLNDRSTADSSDNEIVGMEIRNYLAYEPKAARTTHYLGLIAEKLRDQGIRRTLWSQLSRQYFRLFDIRTFFTTQLPGAGRESYAPRPGWQVALLQGFSHVTYGITLAAGSAGLALIEFRKRTWAVLLGLFVGYNVLAFFLLHAVTRYVIQILPFLMILASVTLHALSARKRAGPIAANGFRSTPSRALLAGAAALTMVFVMTYNLM